MSRVIEILNNMRAESDIITQNSLRRMDEVNDAILHSAEMRRQELDNHVLLVEQFNFNF